MKVVAFPFTGDSVGGSHISAAALIDSLRTDRWKVLVLVHQYGPLTTWLEDRGIPFQVTGLPFLQKLSGLRGLIRLLFITAVLVRYLRKQKIDLVHLNDGRMIHSWTIAARLVGIRVVVHRRTKWVCSRLSNFVFNFADKIVTISEFVFEGVPEYLKAKSVTVYNPICPPAPTYKSHKLVSNSRVVFIGTLQFQKRPHIFIEAAELIIRSVENVTFELIGRDFDAQDDLEKLAENLGISDKVSFSGFHSNISDRLIGAKLLISPAVGEGHGRSLVEAMMLEVPVIASNSGGHKEIIHDGQTGFLVNVDAPAEIASKAVDLLTSSALAQGISRAAKSWARNAFSASSHAAQVEAIYEELFGNE